jgi:hypothetical protein
MTRFEVQRDEWKAALGVYQGDIDTTPTEARSALLARVSAQPAEPVQAAIRAAFESGRVFACDGEAVANLPTCEPCQGTGKRFEWDDLPDCADCDGTGKIRTAQPSVQTERVEAIVGPIPPVTCTCECTYPGRGWPDPQPSEWEPSETCPDHGIGAPHTAFGDGPPVGRRQ